MYSAPIIRAFSILSVLLLISGCVTARTGFDYATVMQKVRPPRPGYSRIVIFGEVARQSPGVVGEFAIGGLPPKQLKLGTYIYADQPAGKHQVLATRYAFPGETRYDITTAPGRTYFLLMRGSARLYTVSNTSMTTGVAGALIATALTARADNPGPFDLLPVDESAARRTLVDQQLAD
jgi:hypothetical protein